MRHTRDWQSLASDASDLFDRLRALGSGAEVSVRFRVGTADGVRVEVPAVSLTLQGELRVTETDRLEVRVPGWGPEDFARFLRRKGRGGPDYWQGAIEHRPEGSPALVLYFTAPADGLEIRARGR